MSTAMAEGQTIEFQVMRDVDRNTGVYEIENMPPNAFGSEALSSIRTHYGEPSLWIKIVNLNDAQVIHMTSILDDVTLFVRSDANSPWLESRAGDQIDQSLREIRSPFVVLPIPANADRSLMFIRVVQSTAVSVKMEGWSQPDFTRMERSDESLKLFLFGFVIATMAYNIFVSALLRDPVFLFNALTIASILVFALYLSGYGVTYFWSGWTGWSNAIFVTSIYTAAVFGSAFLWQFLKSDHETLVDGWPILFAPLLATLVVFLSVVLPFWIVQLCILLSATLLLLSTLVFVCRRAWAGDSKARILIFPLLFAVIPGLALVALQRIFGLDTLRYSSNTLEITFCLEAVLFSLALVARVRLGEQAIRTANENVLRLKYENTVKTVEAQDNERKRLAKELHDGVGQNFLSVVGSLKSLATKPKDATTAQTLTDIVGVATASLNELRRISKDMHPSSVEHLGLKSAVRLLFENLENSDQIETRLDLHFDESCLTSKMELNVYRIFQECLSNVSRHADATCCRAAIVSKDNVLEAYVEDDGTGIENNETETKGLGLISIEERVSSLRGQCHVSRSSEGGTRIEFSFPINVTTDRRREV